MIVMTLLCQSRILGMAGEVQTTLEALSMFYLDVEQRFHMQADSMPFLPMPSNKIHLQAFLLGEFKQRIKGSEKCFSTQTEKNAFC